MDAKELFGGAEWWQILLASCAATGSLIAIIQAAQVILKTRMERIKLRLEIESLTKPDHAQLRRSAERSELPRTDADIATASVPADDPVRHALEAAFQLQFNELEQIARKTDSIKLLEQARLFRRGWQFVVGGAMGLFIISLLLATALPILVFTTWLLGPIVGFVMILLVIAISVGIATMRAFQVGSIIDKPDVDDEILAKLTNRSAIQGIVAFTLVALLCAGVRYTFLQLVG